MLTKKEKRSKEEGAGAHHVSLGIKSKRYDFDVAAAAAAGLNPP
jgi:hypothetical protein